MTDAAEVVLQRRRASGDGRSRRLRRLPGRRCRRHLPHWSPFCQAQYLESTIFLPGYLLSSQGDRMAMAHSVEGRFPFLDHRVAEFAARIPPRLKMKGLCEKYLLKRASRDYVPDSVVQRTKQPYRARRRQFLPQ